MKTRIVLSVLLVLSVAVFFFSKTRAIENEKQFTSVNTSNGPSEFLIGAYHNGAYNDFPGMRPLNFNLWHLYIGNVNRNGYIHPWGWTNRDTLEAPPEWYVPDVKNILKRNADSGYYSLMLRPKIMYLCYGQRSDYQCEHIAPFSQAEWFYSYDSNKTGENILDSGVWVRYCCVDSVSHPADYVVKNLWANREQCNFTWGDLFRDNTYDWYVKPRIRIPTGIADTAHVCRIEIVNWEDSLIKIFELTGWNFKDKEGYYNGQYLDEFKLFTGQNYTPLKISLSEVQNFNPRNHEWSNGDIGCNFDIRVYWYKQCNMWLDYVRMENNVANDLFKGKYDSTYIYWEGEQIGAYSDGKPFKFFIDETEYSHFKCIEYVNKKIQQYCPNVSITCIPFTAFNFLTRAGWIDFSYNDKKNKISQMDMKDILIDLYPFYGDHYMKKNVGLNSYIPNNFDTNCNFNVTKGLLGIPTYMSNYEYFIQTLLDTKGFTDNLRMCNSLSKDLNIPLIFTEQAHLWQSLQHPEDSAYSQREPTNEELEMMADIAVSYGAKSLMYFAYDAWGSFHDTLGGQYQYHRGLSENKYDTVKRYINAYGQKKWEKIAEINRKLKKWGPKIISFNNSSINSYIYRFTNERESLYNNSYFSYFSTLKPGSGIPECNEDFTPQNIPSGFTYDCQNDTYLQIATFGSIETNSQYFMVLNRRCFPYKDSTSENNRGGRRKVRAYLHTDYTAFSAFKNWSIVNCENDSTVAVFNKSNPGYVNLDYFMPGEGRLYKIIPTIETGGTLVCNENFNCDVTCRKNIYNNGYNITIGTSANINFADSVGIYMTGGNLTIGNENEDAVPNYLQFKGIAGSNKWQGFVLDECGIVQVYGGYFYNILPNQSAINIINCYHYKVENNHFVCAKGENSNGVNVIYNTTLDDGPNTYHYIRNNTFSFNESSNLAVQVISNAGTTIPVLIESNHFNIGAGNYSSLGIILTGVSGGVIRQNDITEYVNGIKLLSSDCDFFQNTITSSQSYSTGIQLILAEGISSPSPSNGYFVGGENNIFTSNTHSVNIDVADSYFDIDNGYNVFNIDFSKSQRHISGYFPSNSNSNYNAEYNCWKNNSVVDTASIYVTNGNSGDRISFNTSSTYCGSNEFSEYEVFSLAGGINDTIYRRSGGNGGGQKEGQAMALEIQSGYKLLKDSIEINIRKRYYVQTELQCKRMLFTYPDSSESIGAISKLYLSSLSLDSAGSYISQAKTFFETLILNNPNNTPLIKRANYFVQKCKVALKQYTSALQGFQEIINQNPYSYEGLIASWDYAATQLLASQGGAFSDEELLMINDERKDKSEDFFDDSRLTIHVLHEMLDSLRKKIVSVNSYTTENYDTKKFTKKEREVINANVGNAFSDSRTKQIEKLKELEKKITTLSNSTSNSTSKSDAEKNDAKINEAKKELKTMKTLGEVVKVRKPKDIREHIKIINADIKKVFGTDKIIGSNKPNNLIPTEYNLSQNYPNPFNPVTKINYELPKDGKVKLVIYDILGREIKTLVNELKQAGRYTVEFNGNNYASGVYFYRIQVEGGKSFTSVKKMVLVK